MDRKVISLELRVTVLRWAVGVNAAATIAILGVLRVTGQIGG